MPALIEKFVPTAHGNGWLGTADNAWGHGYFLQLYIAGSQVATLANPQFSGIPTAPTASPGTNTGQIATTAYALQAANAVKDRATHTGLQAASTISDFAAAVGLSPTGQLAHIAGTDTTLAAGTGNAVSASELRSHIDTSEIHAPLDDSTTSATKLWSSAKTNSAIVSAINFMLEAGIQTVNIVGLGNLATLNSVGDSEIGNSAVTPIKLQGGEESPGAGKYYGTSAGGAIGFHSFDQSGLTTLAAGTGNAVSASELRSHIDASAIHAPLDDSTTSASKLWSSDKIAQSIVGAISSLNLGALASLNSVGTNNIETDAVTPEKLFGGGALLDASSYYGTDPDKTIGFHLLPTLQRKTILEPEEGLIDSDASGIYVSLGTTANTAAAGNDSRFPSTGQTAALNNSFGTPSQSNPYLSLNWHSTWAAASTISLPALNADPPANTPGLISASTLTSKFADRIWAETRADAVDQTIEGLQSALATKISFATLLEKWEDGNVFDGDVLDVDYPPRYYAPRSEGIIQAKDSGDLAAHLAGIDDKIGNISSAVEGIQADGVPANVSASHVNYDPGNYPKLSGTVQGLFAGIDQAILTPLNIIDPNNFHADKLHIHWEPTNYTPTSVGVVEVDDNSDLTAHLVGIDNRLAGAANVMAYERQLVARNNYVTLGAYYHIFATARPGTIRRVEIETGVGAIGYPGIKIVVNGVAVGDEIIANYAFPLRETMGEAWPATGRVGRGTTNIPLTAGRGIGVVVTADGSSDGGSGGSSPCKGLRVVIWFAEA